eukprot:Platyproteum_vivax@DN1187_c0_g1_i1.p1
MGRERFFDDVDENRCLSAQDLQLILANTELVINKMEHSNSCRRADQRSQTPDSMWCPQMRPRRPPPPAITVFPSPVRRYQRPPRFHVKNRALNNMRTRPPVKVASVMKSPPR